MPPAENHILFIFSNPQIEKAVGQVLSLSGYVTAQVTDLTQLEQLARALKPDMIMVDEHQGETSTHELIGRALRVLPATPILLVLQKDDLNILKEALHAGACDCVTLPVRSQEFVELVKEHLRRARLRREHITQETRRTTASLQSRLDELEILTQLGRSMISSLEVDTIFVEVVKAAVALTNAQEGSLMLVDEDSGELYMRAALNFNDQFVQTFRLRVSDSLAGLVVRRGDPIMLDEHSPQKIVTSYLVSNLIYVPLRLNDKVIGVLGVDNRTDQISFKDRDLKLLEALAEYAVIAIHNAGLYTGTITQRNQLETIVSHIQDGVIVVNEQRDLLLVNPVARRMFKVKEDWSGSTFDDVFGAIPGMTALIDDYKNASNGWLELALAKNMFYNVQITSIPEVGQVITLHDITPLKRLDRAKSEFVSTVSHDLRSPLTAILGYVDLLERAGTLNDLQRDFIRRVKISVHNITTLVDDLLQLGRIEAGLDLVKEQVDIKQVIQAILESLNNQSSQKNQEISLVADDSLPLITANVEYVKQIFFRLIENAIKYTPESGTIKITCDLKDEFFLIRVSDSGIGVLPAEQAHIFEKFYRGSNIADDSVGTGLGLAIVRAAVEKLSGRLQIESETGKGATFQVELPLNPPTESDSLADKN
ncbi:MAG: ATP-binding protein [Anaerolineae bacterium]|nr:ATP-binding protein [Anaerolineae bacterium]